MKVERATKREGPESESGVIPSIFQGVAFCGESQDLSWAIIAAI